MTANPSGITPLDTKVVLLPEKPAEKTAGGIYLADNTKDREKYAATKAKLVAVGDNAFLDWGDKATKPQAGQDVVIAQYAGSRQKGADGLEYTIANDDEIMAVLEQVQ